MARLLALAILHLRPAVYPDLAGIDPRRSHPVPSLLPRAKSASRVTKASDVRHPSVIFLSQPLRPVSDGR